MSRRVFPVSDRQMEADRRRNNAYPAEIARMEAELKARYGHLPDINLILRLDGEILSGVSKRRAPND
jgi:hypothetical protein